MFEHGCSNEFSLNFILSSVNKLLNWTEMSVFLWSKTELTTLSMEKGTSTHDIVDVVFGVLDFKHILLNNLIVVTIDICSRMVGDGHGNQKLLRTTISHLPSWLGYSCHDFLNLFKAGVSKMNPIVTNLYTYLHSYFMKGTIVRDSVNK